MTLASAQQQAKKFFIYIQNENGSPFYVREKNNTLLSSSHAGYMIIPQLDKGNYVFTIGLPGDQAAEAAFEINLDGDSDKGLLLREGNGQIALYSLKDFKEIQPVAVASAPGNRIVNIPAAPSSAIYSQPPAVEQPPPAVAANDTVTPVAVQKDTGGTDAFSRMLDKIMGTRKPPAAVETTSENRQSTAFDSIQYAQGQHSRAGLPASPAVSHNGDSMQNSLSNNQVINNNSTIQNGNMNDTGKGNPVNNTPPSAPHPPQNNELQFINFLSDSLKGNSVPKTQTVANNPVITTPPVNNFPAKITSPAANSDTATQIAMGNSDCQQLASEDFFQKVRRKMASRSDDEGMFRIAQKYFSGGTCFSAQQIQSLTYLFITDESKFKFLELAYPHAYDSDHFSSLIKTLGSDYYRGRFKAMIR